MQDPACSSARLDRTLEDQPGRPRAAMLANREEHGRNGLQSGEREGDGMEVVEKLGCGEGLEPSTFGL